MGAAYMGAAYMGAGATDYALGGTRGAIGGSLSAEPFGGGWHVEAGHVLVVVDSPSPVFAAIGSIDEVDPAVEGILQRHVQ